MTISTTTRSLAHRSAAGLFIALTAALLAAPALADHDREGVTVFRDVHFRGQYDTFYDDVPGLSGTYVGNDAASSILVPRGCRVTLYRDADFRGPSITLRHDVDDLGDTRLGNDQLTSLRVECRGEGRARRRDRDDRYDDDRGPWRRRDEDNYGPDRGRGRGVTVYEDADFGGRFETFRDDDPDLRDNPIRQDTITSVIVSPGCRAELFQDTGFRGRSTVVFGGVKNLGYTEVGNDRVSSIRVECLNR
jgi:Beta/Gamma crystallin